MEKQKPSQTDQSTGKVLFCLSSIHTKDQTEGVAEIMKEDIMKQEVQGSAGSSFLLKIVCFFLIIMGINLVYTGIRDNIEDQYFNENGVRARGTLTGVSQSEDGDYIGLYEYEVDGITYITYSDVDYGLEEDVPTDTDFWYHPDNVHNVRYEEINISGNFAKIIAGVFFLLMGVLFLAVFVFHISAQVASLLMGIALIVLGFGVPIAGGWVVILSPVILITLIAFGLIGILMVARGTLSLLGKEEAYKKLDKKSGEVMMDLLLKFIDIVSGRR